MTRHRTRAQFWVGVLLAAAIGALTAILVRLLRTAYP